MNWNLVGSVYVRFSIMSVHPSIDASFQVSVHLAKRFQRRRFFRNRSIRNKNCLWRPYLLGSKRNEQWWEAPMEGSVLSFLKAEWNVSDTGSDQCWASSSIFQQYFYVLYCWNIEKKDINIVEILEKKNINIVEILKKEKLKTNIVFVH
jgi:hypothetical protein